MKLRSLLLATVCLVCISGTSSAQTTINNGGFENYDSYGNTSVEPTNWNSFMTADATILTQFGKKQRLNRSEVKRPGTTGTYSVVIWSTNELGTIANGNLTTGKINMGSTSPANSANYNFTKTSDLNFQHFFTGHPDSLVLWVRFKPASNGSETARVHAVIHDNYDMRDPAASGTTAHIVGDATLNFSKTNGLWVRKSIPFVYSGTATASYILISLTTNSTPGGGSAGDSLYIDDMDVVYNPTLTTGTINPTQYLVSSTMSASVTVPFTLTGTMYTGNIVTAQLSDAGGSFASPVVLGTATTTTSGSITGTIPTGTATGSGYRIRVVSSNYALTAADNGTDLIISDVTGVQAYNPENSNVYFSGNELLADLHNTLMTNALLKIYTMEGKGIACFSVNDNQINRHELSLPAGVYVYTIAGGEQLISGKVVKP